MGDLNTTLVICECVMFATCVMTVYIVYQVVLKLFETAFKKSTLFSAEMDAHVNWAMYVVRVGEVLGV
jgi:hypothetical protein